MVTFSYVLMTLLGFSGLFLIGLILLQRGRGGGLAGAFGGMGGQSAFGTKAGDVFTRITIGVASAWILLCAGSVLALHHSTSVRMSGLATGEAPVKKAAPADVVKDIEDAKKAVDQDAAANKPADQKATEKVAPPATQDQQKAKDGQEPADDAKSKEVKPEGGEEKGGEKVDGADATKPKPE